MGQHGPLADARGPPGVEQCCQLIPPGLVFHRPIGIFADEIHELVDIRLGLHLPEHAFLHIGKELLLGKWEVVADVAGDDGLDLRFRLDLERPGKEQIQCDQHRGVRVVELMRQLPLGVEGIVHGSDGPGTVNGMVGDDSLGDVGQKHPHLVALLDPDIDQGSRESVYQSFQLTVGDLLPHVDTGHAVWILRSGLAEPFRHSDPFHLKIRGYARHIRFVP